MYPTPTPDPTGASESLADRELRFRQLADALPLMVWMARPDGVLDYYNQRWYDFTGFSPETIGDQSWEPILHPDDVVKTYDRWYGAVRGGQPYDIEYRFKDRRAGGYRWFLGRALPLKDAAGNVLRWFGSCVDIDDQKRAEQQLRDERETVDEIYAVGRTLAAQLDLNDIVQSVTDATTRLTGARFGAFFYNVVNERGESYSLYTLSGVSREAFARFPMPRNTEIFAPTFAGQGAIRLADVTADPRYGHSAPHHGMPAGHLPVRSYLAVPVVSRSGEVLGGLFYGHEDVGVFTARHEQIATGVASQAAVAIDNARLYLAVKRAAAEREQLLEAERAARTEAERQSQMKDEFLATLSHELRTPLNAILGWSQLLNGTELPGEAREGIDVIERNARAQTRLIEDLLDMSRIISGQVRLDVQRVDVAPVIEASVASIRPAADARGVRLVQTLDPLAGPVKGDPARLQQVVWNVLSNAVKFTPRGGRVQVTLERVNSHLEVTVSDTGQGIPAAFLPHVFDRFRQADQGTTRRHGGLGLGLSIVKHLVELHGGAVRATSPGENRGATFTIDLPLMALHDVDGAAGLDVHPQAESVGAPGRGDCPTLAGVSVLVVDDEPDARDLVRRLLEQCQATAVTAASAAEGFELLRARRPDVVISDIGMPGEDGYHFIRNVRALRPDGGGNTPALALTAFARSEDRTRAILAGYQVHLSKPVEPAELVAMVASLAGRNLR